MELKDLQPGDKVKVKPSLNPFSDYLRGKNPFIATVVIVDSVDPKKDVAIGYLIKGEKLPFDFVSDGSGPVGGQVRLPNYEAYKFLWVNHADIQSKEGSGSNGTGATCACGYQNPYASSPYKCTSCKLWEHVAR